MTFTLLALALAMAAGGAMAVPLWRASRPWALAMGISVPLLASALYLLWGEPRGLEERWDTQLSQAERGDTQQQGDTQGQQGDTHLSDPSAASLEQLAARLARRLEAEPGDGPGWLLLGRTYLFLGRTDEAVRALRRAAALGAEGAQTELADLGGVRKEEVRVPTLVPKEDSRQGDVPVPTPAPRAAAWRAEGRELQARGRYREAEAAFARWSELEPDSADAWADRADAAAMSQGGTFAGAPARYAERALRADRDHIKALWLMGSVELERRAPQRAARHWRRLEALLPEGDPLRETIAANLAGLGATGRE